MTTDHVPLPIPPTEPAPPPMVAKTPEDLLAAVPVVLGFHPAESLVMICCGPRQPGDRQFHARIDLPPPHRTSQLGATVEPLLQAVRAHRVEQVAFVVYTAHPRLARAASRAVETAFADVGLHTVIRAHAGRWSPLTDGVEGPRHPYDTELHAFALRAMVEGHVVHADRSALAASLARDRSGYDGVAAALAHLPPFGAGGPPADEVGWALAAVDAASADGPLSSQEVARLVRLMAHVGPRDAVWLRLSRRRAPDLIAWWSDVVRRTPDALLPDVAFLLAFTAWLSGHGALAWCALDRVFALTPEHSAAHLLAAMLEGAVPPTDWEDLGAADGHHSR